MPFFYLLLLLQSAYAAECPKTGEAWSRWRKQVVAEAKSLDDLSEAGLFLQTCEANPATAAPFSDFLLGACLEPLKNFSLAYNGKDRRGDNVRPAFEYSPEEKALLGGTPQVRGHHGDNDNAAGVEKVSLTAVETLVTKFPGSHAVQRNNHVIVVLPGEKFDRWYWLSRLGTMQIDILKLDEEGKPQPKPLAYFTDNPLAKTKPLDDVAGCTKCHMTGIVPLLVQTDSQGQFSTVFAKQNLQRELGAMNKLAKQTSNAVPSMVNVSDYGPAFGPVDSPGRTKAFLSHCAKDEKLSKDAVHRLKSAMNCASCHNGKGSALLNAPIGLDEKVSHGVLESGHMPPGAEKTLTVKERGQVRDCLMQEYYGRISGAEQDGLLQKWLLVPSCPTASSADSLSVPKAD